MKTIINCCPSGTKNDFSRIKISLKSILMLLFFGASFSPQVFSQNGCQLKGSSRVFVGEANQSYSSVADQPSTFVWTLTNSDGATAKILSFKTAPDGSASTAEVESGLTSGSFLVKTVITSLIDGSIQECSRSVPIYSKVK